MQHSSFNSKCLSTTTAYVHVTAIGPFLPFQRRQPALAGRALRDPLARGHPPSRQRWPQGGEALQQPSSQGAGFGPLHSAFPSSLKRLLKLACGKPHYCFVLPFYFSWHLFTCWGQGSLQTKANRVFRGTERKKWYNLCWQNGNSICFPTAPAAAPLPSHRALTWLPSRGQACVAALTLGSLATRHHHGHQAQTFRNIMAIYEQPPKCPDRHLKGLSKVLPLPHPLRVGHNQCPPKAVLSPVRSLATKSLAAEKGLAPFPSLRLWSSKSRAKMQLPSLVWARGPQDPSTSCPAPCLALCSLAGTAQSPVWDREKHKTRQNKGWRGGGEGRTKKRDKGWKKYK